jgi:hypothetical protein
LRESPRLIRGRDFHIARCIDGYGEQLMHARVLIDAAAMMTPGITSREDQRPSFALSMSLTACGLALPPDDFITWPTNQPINAGFA